MSLFHWRQDVYARRWEKWEKHGWSPAYSFDWDEFNVHRANGGTMKDFQNKTYTPYTAQALIKHLEGKDMLGIYPILLENTSYFLTADFDESNWREQSKNFIHTCEKYGIHSYPEISQSGNGCHVWIFFEDAYPCWKSRKIFLELIRQALGISPLKEEKSFDRLFPNQDALTGGYLGNLIALPLQGNKVSDWKTVFYDKNGNTYADQYEFLKSVQKVSLSMLDALYEKLFISPNNTTIFDIEWWSNNPSNISRIQASSAQPIHIVLSGAIFLRLSELPSQLIAFIKQELNIFNTEYAIKKKLGKSVYKTERYFHLLEESGDTVIIPRGFLPALLLFLESNSIAYEIIEKYEPREPTKHTSFIQLREYQKDLIRKISEKHNGIIIAPPWSGKTVIALDLVAQKQTKTLILVNRRELLAQWVERIEQFLWISKTHIGVISGTKKKVGERVTVATFQSLTRYEKLPELHNAFDMIIVDECHHISAESYRKIVLKFSTKYCFGLTATHERQFGKEKIAELMIGGIIGELESHENVVEQSFEIRCIQTDIFLPFRYSTSHYETLAKTICYDTGRNQLIVKEVMTEVKNGRKVLLLTERKEHIEILLLYLKTLCECITLSGDDAKSARDLKMKQIRGGHYSIIIATGQFLWEWIDVPGIESLVLAFPFGFKGKLIQYIWRMRWVGVKSIIDFCDGKIPFLLKQWKSREKYYREKCGYQEQKSL